MIKLNDLRVGNCVNFKTKEGYKSFPVNKIDASCGTCEFVYCEGNISAHVYVNEFYDLEPIPLTEDILMKCGFVKGDSVIGECLCCTANKCWIGLYWDKDCFILANPHYTLPIKYLHELQNLYFALTKSELKIEL